MRARTRLLHKRDAARPSHAPPADPARQQLTRGDRSEPALGDHSLAKISIFPPDSPPDSSQRVPGPLGEQFARVTGHSIDGVRVHTGEASQQAARERDARALTIGRDIHFAAGEFRPGTDDGDRLIAHELTHAVQQRGARPTAQLQIEDREPGEDAEDEADEVADAVLSDEELEPPAITERPPAIFPKKKTTPKKTTPKTPPKAPPKAAPKPKPARFDIFDTKFEATLDAANNVTVKKRGRSDGGWKFTPAGPNTSKAERTLDRAEYVHASGLVEAFTERCTITVPAGGAATVSKIVAELGSPSKLTIELSAPKFAAKTKSTTVNAIALKQLDLPAAAITFTPADGDSIHLALGGEAWVFTTLKQDPVPPATKTTDVKGFFNIGFFTRYKDKGVLTYGIASPSVSDADRKKAIDDLAKSTTPAARQITANEAELFKTVSLIESDFAGVQTYDTGILSFGFAQWTVHASLPRMLSKVDAPTFERYLGRYGLAVHAPVRQLDNFVYQFLPRNFVDDHLELLGIQKPLEGALFLNTKELVNQRLMTKAASQAIVMNGFAKRANDLKAAVDAAKPDLTSTDTKKKAAAGEKTADAKKLIDALRTAMAGLRGMKTVADPSKQAEALATVAADGETAAKEVATNCQSSEVMRGEQWVLRFQMLGKSAGGIDAEIARTREMLAEVTGKSTRGAAFTTLLPHLRGRAALLSSFINLPGSADRLGGVVDSFKLKKQKDAKAAAAAAAKSKTPVPASTGSEADWKAFPWPPSDKRWTALWIAAAIDAFEAMAVFALTKPKVTDPERRREIIKKQFP